MKPIDLEGKNVTYGADQPEYEPLPARKLHDKEGTIITCWELSDDEVAEIVKRKKLFISCLTFGQPLNPILPSTTNIWP